MSLDSNNPFESPREASQTKQVARRGNSILTSLVAMAFVFYAAFTVLLIFTGNWRPLANDAIVGGMFLCNWPVLGIWLWSVWAGNTRAFIFGLIAIALQMGITLSMIVFLPNARVEAVLGVNGTIVAVFLVLTLLIRWVQAPLYRQESKINMGS